MTARSSLFTVRNRALFGISKTQSHNERSRGFTLIELLVVIAIIGILGSIVLASLNTSRKKGRDARRVADVKQVQTALELYLDNTKPNSYPTLLSGNWSALGTALEGAGHIQGMPIDPVNNANYYYDYTSTNGAIVPNPCNTGPCTGYVIHVYTETRTVTSGVTGLKAGFSCTPGASSPHNFCMLP